MLRINSIFIFFLLSSINSFSQNELSIFNGNREAGLGYLPLGDGAYILNISYSWRISSNKMLMTPFYYINLPEKDRDNKIQHFETGIALINNLSRPERRFNVSLNPEFTIDYYTRNYIGFLEEHIDPSIKRLGLNLYLGITPRINLIKNWSISFDFKYGISYKIALNYSDRLYPDHLPAILGERQINYFGYSLLYIFKINYYY